MPRKVTWAIEILNRTIAGLAPFRLGELLAGPETDDGVEGSRIRFAGHIAPHREYYGADLAILSS